MDLEATGWPQLPAVGSEIEFTGGGVSLQVAGVCTVVRADHVRNAAGKPGGRITLRTARGHQFQVPLSQLREHAVPLADGLAASEAEGEARRARDHG